MKCNLCVAFPLFFSLGFFILFHQFFLTGSFFDFSQLHHETFALIAFSLSVYSFFLLFSESCFLLE